MPLDGAASIVRQATDASNSGCAFPGRSSLLLDGESELPEHPYGAGLPALEVTGAKSLVRSELIRRAQDRFRRVTMVCNRYAAPTSSLASG